MNTRPRTFRIGINFGNALLTSRDADGSPRGIAVDLAHELARRAGASLELVSYESAGRMADRAKAGEWDVAFLATDPARADEIVFTEPYLAVDSTYLVWTDAPFVVPADLDREGVRISVSEKSAYDLFLTRALKHSRLIRAVTPNESVELFFSGRLEALAGLRPLLIDVAEKHPGTRILDGSFMTVQQAVGVAKSCAELVPYVREFVKDIKTSGLVAQLVEKNNLRGISGTGIIK
jgi:polar amino acid transport system substrate-binding protein